MANAKKTVQVDDDIMDVVEEETVEEVVAPAKEEVVAEKSSVSTQVQGGRL